MDDWGVTMSRIEELNCEIAELTGIIEGFKATIKAATRKKNLAVRVRRSKEQERELLIREAVEHGYRGTEPHS